MATHGSGSVKGGQSYRRAAERRNKTNSRGLARER
jgi:hypothetical protein